VRRFSIAVVTCSLAMSGTASAELQKQDRDELFQRIDHMCRDASSVGEVVTYEGSLDAGATLKVVGLNATGKVTKEQWKNIEQKYGEFRGTPTICNIEMFKLIVPLFGEKVPSPKTCTNQAFGLASWANEETLNGTSGWRGGGYNQGAYCTEFINSVIQGRGLGNQPHLVDEIKSSEENRRTGFMNSVAQYNYHCSIKLHWNPIYNAKADAICGLE
jgi:hypothetical protein